jgi:hypothetical protein
MCATGSWGAHESFIHPIFVLKNGCDNYAEVPTFEKLDRILVTTDWEHKFPLASIRALTREISDHTPLLLDEGNHLIGAILGISNSN